MTCVEATGLRAGTIAIPLAWVDARVVPAQPPRVAVVVSIAGYALTTASIVSTNPRALTVLIDLARWVTASRGAQAHAEAVHVVLAGRRFGTSSAVGVADLIPRPGVGDTPILAGFVEANSSDVTVVHVLAGCAFHTAAVTFVALPGPRAAIVVLTEVDTSSPQAIAVADAVDIGSAYKRFDTAAGLDLSTGAVTARGAAVEAVLADAETAFIAVGVFDATWAFLAVSLISTDPRPATFAVFSTWCSTDAVRADPVA